MLARFSKFLNFENLNFGERERERSLECLVEREREKRRRGREEGERDGRWIYTIPLSIYI